MGREDNGLTLEGLAQRLETMQREHTEKLAALECENIELRNEVTALRSSDTTRRNGSTETRSLIPRQEKSRGSEYEGVVSRRSLLSKAGAAAVAAMAAGALMYPRQARANHYDNDAISADVVMAHDISTVTLRADSTTDAYATVLVYNYGSGPGVSGDSASGTGVEGISNAFTGAGVAGKANGRLGYGVKGTGGFIGVDGFGNVGVRGTGTDVNQAGVKGEGATGVLGSSSRTGYSGVYGEHTGSSGYGVVGNGKGEAHAGVLGRNQGGTGVHGQSSKTGYGAITAEHTGTSGYGVVGLGKGPSAGVLGRNGGAEGVRGEGSVGVRGDGEAFGVRGDGAVIGVRGESFQAGTSGVYGISSSGVGVQGNGGETGIVGTGKTGVRGTSERGYGGEFEGGKAQLMLKPGGSAGKPTTGTHKKGEIYMDSAGTLFVCVAASTATAAAKWRKFTTTAV